MVHLRGFKHLKPADVQALYDWWGMNGLAQLWGDKTPDPSRELTAETYREYVRLSLHPSTQDEYLEFTNEVLHAQAMVLAAFSCGATGVTWCWECKRMAATQGMSEYRCCEEQLLILGLEDL